MKKRIFLIFCLVLALMLTSCGNTKEKEKGTISTPASSAQSLPESTDAAPSMEVSSENTEPAYFEKNDCVVNNLKLGMTPEEVVAVLGEPNTQESSSTDDYIYGEYLQYTYPGLMLRFYAVFEGLELTLGDIQVSDSSIQMNNDLHVGAKAEEVFASYTQEYPLDSKKLGEPTPWGYMIYGDYLYAADQNYVLPSKLEHSAFYTVPNEMNQEYYITYACYEPFEQGYAETSVTYYIDANDIVSRVNWEYDLFK